MLVNYAFTNNCPIVYTSTFVMNYIQMQKLLTMFMFTNCPLIYAYVQDNVHICIHIVRFLYNI